MEEYIVSARKYRPITFDSVVGQYTLTTTLKNAVKSKKLAHAYLFCGPRGVGKTTCARIFAKVINCEHPTENGEACNECESCKAFNEQRSYNIFELDAASNNGVDQIKSLMEQTRIPPQIGKYKVFIIDEVHMLSPAAFNAFLKTLEEPPSHVIFILATTEKHKILPTILSRCQIYDFERMTVPNTISHLKMVAEKEGIKYDEQALAVIAEKADGGMRDALSIFDQTVSFCQGELTYKKVIEDLNVLDSDNYFNLIDLALDNKVSNMMLCLDKILSKGFDGANTIQGLAQHIRNVMMAKDAQTLPLLECSNEQKAKYQKQAQKAPKSFLYQALKITNNCDCQYRQSSNKRLLVELTLIQIGQITQPEDEEASGAGRMPHRLKSLFQNSLGLLKPVVQGTGATPISIASQSNIPQSIAHKTVASFDTQSITGTTISQHPHKGNNGQIKLGKIGMTFQNLMKAETHSRHNEDTITSEEIKVEEKPSIQAIPFNQEQIEAQWMSMCMRMQNVKEMIGLAQRLKVIIPRLTNYPHVEIVVDNQFLLDDIIKIKNRIRLTLVKGLSNPNIDIEYRLAKQEEVGKILSKGELLAELKKSNPAINKLCEKFKLVMV